jgi:hypothetical protein
MPHFYFHLRNGAQLEEDKEGHELESLFAARREAILGARDVMAERVRAGREPDGSQFEITDESGKIILIVPFEEAYSRDRPARGYGDDQVS